MTERPRVVPVTAFGRRFRSTTEARWAVFLSEAGIGWEYETETYDLGTLGWYLPDFWLPARGWFLEVKPGRERLLDEHYDRAKALHVQTRRPVLVASGMGSLWAASEAPHAPGWIYDVMDLSDPSLDSAGAGGDEYRLGVRTDHCPTLLWPPSQGLEDWLVDRCPHADSGFDQRRTARAYAAATSFRPGR